MYKSLSFLLSTAILCGCSSLPMTSHGVKNNAQHPVLTSSEARHFTIANYFAQGHTDSWQPEGVTFAKTSYVVGPAGQAPFQDIQQAINSALIHDHDSASIAIKLLPGRYEGVVYIPSDAPKLTLYGAGKSAKDTVIAFAIDSKISPAQYRKLVNHHHRYQAGDPAWYMYQVCANKDKSTIATICSAVLWSQSNQFSLANVTVENSMLDAVGSGTHQGVALRTDGDKVQIENVRLLGRQDTFFVNNAGQDNQYNVARQSRVYIKNSYIEGDVDYVFGRAQAVFDGVHFNTVSTRHPSSAYVFAPDTPAWLPYGFLVVNSKLSCDKGFKDFSPKLGRAWDQGASHTGYIPGHTANGQLVIANSTIQSCYDLSKPWGKAATTGRPFRGNALMSRTLNSQNFNRLWLFNDTVL
ncbi:putative acyl-CoA thioester hydrolase [Celerinatantimonas sp. MCCC 1A17872]|uniref:putative acyl-CoA thioester hydrolase n=1 Tax=Celerinatantimonas sp. MCCC 1A17872 TaxID=3177514 RepID=UPI0038C7B624